MRVLSQFTPAVVLIVCALSLSACKSAEERAEELYQNAQELIAEGDADRAIVQLRNVFDLNNSHIGARRAMAELQLERGNLRGAYRQYLFLAEKYPDDLESRIKLSDMAFAIGNWEELDRHGGQAQELAPEDPRVKAITLVRNYRQAINDDDAAARRDLGRQADAMLASQSESILLHSVLMDDAIRDQRFTRALEEVDWIIAKDPRSSRYYKERLRILATLGDMSAVEAQLRELIKIFPDDPAHIQTLLRFYISRNDLDAAEGVLRDYARASDPEDPGPTVDLIRFLAEFRETEMVKSEIKKAVSERPDPVPFQLIGAVLDFSLGKRSEAIAELEDVLEKSEASEQSSEVKITLAKMLLATGNEVGARTHVEEVLAEEATNPDALKMKASWQIEADDTDAALSGLRTALDQAPQDAEIMTLMASAYIRSGQTELAKDFLAQAVEASGNAPAETLRYAQLLIREQSYLPAEDILLAALRLAPSNIDILVSLGQLYLQMEDFGRVQSVIDTLRRIGGDNAIPAANAIEAERLNRQKGIAEAMSFLEELANDSEANLATRIALVRARLSTGDNASALALAQELKDEYPDNDAVDSVVAVAQIANGDLDAAEQTYRVLLDKDPVRPRIWRALSRLQMRKGDREAAKAMIDEGLGHTPDNADLLWAKASFQEQDGDIDAAIETYQALYENTSNSIIVANNLASLLATYRDDEASLDRAWTIARRLRDAKVPALQDTYGWILHRRGGSEEALQYLEAAAQGLPKDPIVQYHLGQALVALERRQDALAQFRKAVEIAGPTDTRAQIEEARALVRSLQKSDAAED